MMSTPSENHDVTPAAGTAYSAAKFWCALYIITILQTIFFLAAFVLEEVYESHALPVFVGD